MVQRSRKLANLLFIRGLARQVVPVAIVWSAWDWYRVSPYYAAVFLMLTGNYLLVWVFSWVARSLLNGPWRVRPWQTLILIANFVALPIVFYLAHKEIVWGFLAINLLLFISLIVSTAVLFYLGDKLPAGQAFALGRGIGLPGARATNPKADSGGTT
jgi:hypothetical protein